MKESKNNFFQEIQHDEKHKVLSFEDHNNDIPFNHTITKKNIWQNEKTTYYILLVDEE